MPNYAAAADQLVAAARDKMPGQMDMARRLLRETGDRDRALAMLTIHFMSIPSSGVAAIAADALLRLAEER